MRVLLSGIVGSTAYGLAREGSDVDRLGVFVAPTVEVAGLDWHPRFETHHTTKPDNTFHEVGKFLRLALNGNPSVTELLWLPGEYLETADPFYGLRLIGLRDALLCERSVRSAYGEYANRQADKLLDRNITEVYDSEEAAVAAAAAKHLRRTKHARHVLRLLRQGRELLATGRLSIRVSNPDDYFAFDHMKNDQMYEVYQREGALFGATKSVLPAQPDVARIHEYLTAVRANFLMEESCQS